MVQYFIDGGAFMWPILISLIFGLGFALERAYSLIMSSIDSDKFFTDISETINIINPINPYKYLSNPENFSSFLETSKKQVIKETRGTKKGIPNLLLISILVSLILFSLGLQL